MRYIAIEREYGSGGTEIARELAKVCNIPCYGQEILERASVKMNMPVESIQRYEEKATNSLMYSLYMLSQVQSGNGEILSTEGKVFYEEQNAIRELAHQGSAIFLGHCASETLKECGEVIRVYIHADTETKKERIKSEYGISESHISEIERKNNRRRANYFTTNTQKRWDDYHIYDIVLDSSKLGIDGSVNVLKGLILR